MVVRGVPGSLRNDAWWMDGGGAVGDGAPPRRWSAFWLLLVCGILADRLIWAPSGGLGVVIWVLLIAAAVHFTVRADVDRKRAALAWLVLIIALVPAIDLVQALSVMFALLGLLAFAGLMVSAQSNLASVLRIIVRLPWAGLSQNLGDVKALRVDRPAPGALKRLFVDWALSLIVGGVFVVLMALGNPIVDQWLVRLGQLETGFDLSFGRLVFWVAVLAVVWPLLRIGAMTGRLNQPTKMRQVPKGLGLFNARSVLRALILFNVIFAIQSVLDAGYLWGGVALPEGMTYAQYAHRGAYPLLLTALMAGGFAIAAQPFIAGRPILRGLLYVWVAQTVLLVLSSILRLDLYVDAYGLTRLRFAAFIWMGLVALGLVLMIIQMVMRENVGWFLLRAAGLGAVTLYICALVNIDGYLAANSLARTKPDVYYVCNLGEGAVPAIAEFEAQSGHHFCHSSNPSLSLPNDWREWGYRNARLRRSLSDAQAEDQG